MTRTLQFDIPEKLEGMIADIATVEETTFEKAAMALLGYGAEIVHQQSAIERRIERGRLNRGRAVEILKSAKKVDLETGDELPPDFSDKIPQY